jgi:hypothetical protein
MQFTAPLYVCLLCGIICIHHKCGLLLGTVHSGSANKGVVGGGADNKKDPEEIEGQGDGRFLR